MSESGQHHRPHVKTSHPVPNNRLSQGAYATPPLRVV